MNQPGTTEPADQNDVNANVVNVSNASVAKIQSQLVSLDQSNVDEITADDVKMKNSAARNIYAQQATIEESAVAIAQVGTLNATETMIVGASTQEAVVNGTIGALISQAATLNDSRSALVISRTIHGSRIQTGVLLAGRVEAPVETMIDTRQAAIFGVAAGVAVGLVLGLFRMFSVRR